MGHVCFSTILFNRKGTGWSCRGAGETNDLIDDSGVSGGGLEAAIVYRRHNMLWALCLGCRQGVQGLTTLKFQQKGGCRVLQFQLQLLYCSDFGWREDLA